MKGKGEEISKALNTLLQAHNAVLAHVARKEKDKALEQVKILESSIIKFFEVLES